MDYNLTENQIMIRDLTRKIALEKILPQRQILDEEEKFPRELMKFLADAGLCGLYIPEEWDGFGGGAIEFCLATEEISRVCGGVGVTFAATALCAYPILLFGTDEQKKKYLPSLAKGEKLGAFGLTEPAAGSDVAAMQTTAQKEGTHFILNGTKHFITNGGEAEVYLIFAMTDRSKGSRGATAFIIEKGTPGFEFGKKEKKMGIRCSSTRELIFNNCKVPKENILGREGMGFIVAIKTLEKTRPGIGAQAVGIAQGAFDEALKYARERIQFEAPLTSFQAIQHMLADMATKIEAARSLVYSVAKAIDNGANDVSRESAMCKLFASDVAMEVTTNAVQILGGYGYMREYPVEKYMRDAKITQIYEGTNQIQRNIIALSLIKESAGGKKI